MAYELSDEEWAKPEALLPKKKMERPFIDSRRTLSGIKRILKTGSPWSTLPSEFGKWNSVYRYFCRLQQKGVFEKIFAELTKEVFREELSPDSTFVKVHRHGLEAKKVTRLLMNITNPCIPCKNTYKGQWKTDKEQ